MIRTSLGHLVCGLAIGLGSVAVSMSGAASEAPGFRHVEIDSNVGVGYGVNVSDVDGDGQKDILLVDEDVIVWYENPDWEKHVIAEDLTDNDHVCIAARDITGDGKTEIAVGADWAPWDTLDSGAIFYLEPPDDRTAKWEPIPLPNDPVIHRMRWVRKNEEESFMVSVPLHGRGNENGEGAGVRVLAYQKPADPYTTWPVEVVTDQYHETHNIDPVQWDNDPAEEILLASREGLFLFDRHRRGQWREEALIERSDQGNGFPGASEIRMGKLEGNQRYVASIEPFHGHQAVVYTASGGGDGDWSRQVLDDTLNQGHAVACGDLADLGYEQLVVGWRQPNDQDQVGIKLFIPDAEGSEWSMHWIDRNEMACEDLRLADLDDDGRLDVVAAGRGTHNLKIYFNEGRQ